MLTDKQLQCIELLGEGLLTKVEIAKKIGVSDRVIYKWQRENEEFIKELRKRSAEIQTVLKQEGKARMCAKGQIAIENIAALANHAESEKVRLDANTFIYEVIFGKATTKIEQSSTDSKDDTSESLVLDAIQKEKDKNEPQSK